MNFLTKYNHARGSVFQSDLPSMTDPQYKSDCDINVVVDRACRGSVPEFMDRGKGTFGDVSQFADFASMMDTVNRGTAAFMDVPSEIRARFGNDPKAFFRFATDPANSDEMVKLGLAEKFVPAVEKPVKVEVVSSAAPNATA